VRTKISPAVSVFLLIWALAAPPEARGSDFKLPSTDSAAWRLEAATQEQQGDEIVATGDVWLSYGDIVLQADKVVFNRATNAVTAAGNVVVQQGSRKVTGDLLEMNIKDNTGVIYGAVAFEEPTYFFAGDRIVMLDSERFILYRGLYTTCNQPTPYWGLRSSSCRVKVEGYARFRNLRFMVRGVPVFYLPYWVWPVKQERSSGMLIPEPGYSQFKGWYMRNQFYWASGRSHDATLTYDWFELYGQGAGLEYRFVTGAKSKGRFDGYGFEETATGRHRYFTRFEYDAKPWGGRFYTLYEDSDSLDYYRNFEYFLDSISTRRTRSNAYYSRNWKNYSGNFLLERELSYLNDTEAIELNRLPDLSVRRRLIPLWKESPLLMAFEFFGTNIIKDTPLLTGSVKTDEIHNEYQRAVFRPMLSLPWTPGPWMNVNFQTRGFFNYYTKSADPADSRRVVDDTLWYKYWSADMQVLGPRFEKIFKERDHGYFGRFKHVIEPQFSYRYQTEDKDGALFIPRFDSYDSTSSFSHVLNYSLVNYLYGKPRQGNGSPAEVAKLTIAQSYSLDPDRYLSTRFEGGMQVDESYFSPVTVALRLYPLGNFGMDASLVYDYLYGDIARAQMSGQISAPKGSFARLTWSYGRSLSTGLVSTHQLRAEGGLSLLDQRLRFDGELSYDVDRSTLQHQRYTLRYANQCSAFVFDVTQKNLGEFDDLEYRFSIELKDVGTILSL
jgi:LPS-assembly protein